jgi:hypothetical protein
MPAHPILPAIAMTPSLRSPIAILGAICLAGLAAACGGGAPESMPPPVTMPIALSVSGRFVARAEANPTGFTLVEEKALALDQAGPDRSVVLLDAAGGEAGSYAAPAGWSLIDATRHPSGDTTVLLAASRTVMLVRLDRSGRTVVQMPLLDADAADDPYFDGGGAHDDGSLVPTSTRDAARLAAIGEDLAVALRTGRNAVVAYRFARSTAGYGRAWRTLVEPGLSLFPESITSGTFDVFHALENHWHVLLDADADGNIVVAVASRPGNAPVFAAHAAYFGEPIAASVGALVTRLAPDGHRIGTTVVDTVRPSELQGLRLSQAEVIAMGRVFTERRADGAGWDGYLARIDRPSGMLAAYRVVDIDRGEALFDAAPLAQSRLLVAGAAGYTQNPDGASIPESMTPLLAILEADGTLRQRIALGPGARQNQVRAIAALGSRRLVAGMVNGPGTHSGDADRTAIRADGFVREVEIPAP